MITRSKLDEATMHIHFDREEFSRRQQNVCRKMQQAGLDGLLIFRQESMYYLTGYDTEGFVLFQAMYMSCDGRIALLTRSADRLQARITSTLEDVRIWVDREGANPAQDLKDLLAEYGCAGKHIGVEYEAYGLTGQRAMMVNDALDGFCHLSDASDLVRLVRLVKSPAELNYVRKAGKIVDAAWNVANQKSVPGAFLGDVYGEMMHVMMSMDGDPSASRWPMGAGTNSMLVRYHTGKETIGTNDQVQHEFAGSFRHYHAAAMSVIITGDVDPRQQAMFHACREALERCKDALRPGATVGEIYDAHKNSLTAAGYGHACLNACGYTLGITYPPSWMDWPMLWTGNPDVIEEGMVFFMHMILLDDTTNLTMSLGETAIVTSGACEPVCHAPQELIVN